MLLSVRITKSGSQTVQTSAKAGVKQCTPDFWERKFKFTVKVLDLHQNVMGSSLAHIRSLHPISVQSGFVFSSLTSQQTITKKKKAYLKTMSGETQETNSNVYSVWTLSWLQLWWSLHQHRLRKHYVERRCPFEQQWAKEKRITTDLGLEGKD